MGVAYSSSPEAVVHASSNVTGSARKVLRRFSRAQGHVNVGAASGEGLWDAKVQVALCRVRFDKNSAGGGADACDSRGEHADVTGGAAAGLQGQRRGGSGIGEAVRD